MDKAGSDHDFNSTVGSEPTVEVSSVFSKRVLHFTANQWMRQPANFGSPVTVIAVARPRVVPSGRLLQGVANNWLLGWWANRERVGYFEGWVSYPGVPATTDGHVVSAVVRGAGLATDVAVDGATVATGTGGSSGPNGLGVNSGGAYGGESSDLELAEIVVFPRALTVSDRAMVESALARKWGVTFGKTMTARSSISQTGSANTVATSTPQVLVTDPYGAPMTGVSVTFTANAGSTVGGASSAVVNTDINGLATSPKWTLGLIACTDRVVATAIAAPSVTFSADKPGCGTYGVSGVAMWVDASDTDGDGNAANEPALNSPVMTLTDKSGFGRNFVSQAGSQPTLESSTAFRRNVLHFTRLQWMRQTANFASPSTVIYVARSRTTSSSRVLQSVGNNWLLGWWNSAEGSAYFDGWVNMPASNSSTTNARIFSAVIRGSGQNTTVFADGSSLASNANGTSGPNGLGINGGGAYPSEATDADLGEILVFPRALTVVERSQIETALAMKWGISTPVTNGLVVSLDANNQSTMYQESTGTTPVSAAGQRVCRWSDLTPTANHAVQPTAAQCPTYGTDPTGGFVNFTANGKYTVTPTLSPDATVLVVAQSNTTNWNEYGWLASARGPNGFIIHPSVGNGSVQFYPVNSSGSYTYVGGATYSPITNPALYEFTMKGSSPVSGVYGRNGVTSAYSAAGVTRSAGPVRVVLGADDYAGRLGNGKYREVLIYNRALSGDELTAVENYLRAKWGTG